MKPAVRLLFFGINYEPELTGIGKYTGELCAYLAARGHDVEVITAPPYYPEWRVKEPYANTFLKETRDGVTVMRCPLYVPQQQSGTRRILQELTFVLSSLRWWAPRMLRRYDAIVAISPPFHLPLLPLLHRGIHGTPVVNHVQDLQVDAARELRLISSAPLLRLLVAAERWIMRRVDLVSSISAGMIARIRDKGVGEERLRYFPNWVDGERIFPLPPERSLRARFGIPPEQRVVLYAGNLGQKQGLEVIPQLAARFRGSAEPRRHGGNLPKQRDDVLFLVVGAGGALESLKALVAEAKLDNVRFEGLQPLEDLSAMLAMADVHLVLQKKAAADLVMPSKLTNIIASGGHALVTASPGTTLHEVVTTQRIGTIAEPENLEDILRQLRRILDGTARDEIAGLGAFAKTLHKETIIDAFERDLRTLMTRDE